MKDINFIPQQRQRLLPTLRKRVKTHLAEITTKNTERLRKLNLYSKAIIMFAIWLTPFILMFIFSFSYLITFLLAVITGIGMAGIGMNVMHDASHGTFSAKRWVNKLFANSIYLLAGNTYNWDKQHNVIHHTHTNIEGMDDDMDSKGLFRLSDKQPWKWGHRFQYLYALPLYSLMTILWATTKDWFQMARYFKNDDETSQKEKRKQWGTLIFTKILYFSIWLVLPFVFWSSGWHVMIFFLTMHIVCGSILTIVFQLAHIVPKAQVYEAGEEHRDPLIHQLLTSCNFATNSRILTWYLGGLNFQKEHHVFPSMSHTLYPKIQPVIKEFCREQNIEYTEYKFFLDAVTAHFIKLYQLSRKPIVG